MVTRLIGNLLESKAQTLVNTVNCVGVMGKGIALQFRERFPDMYEDYVKRCADHKVHLGKPYLFKRLISPWIANFPTKAHWRSVARIADIIAGLKYLAAHYREWGITSLAVPPLGCGEGQLDWAVVGPTLYRYLTQLDIPVELYAPYGTPEEQLKETFLARPVELESNVNGKKSEHRRIDPAWVALVAILDRIQREPYHWPIGRTTFQKIAYFATESGLPTSLRFHRGSYGPFAPDLKPFTTRLVNNGLIQEEQLGQMFAVKPGPTFADAANRFSHELEAWDSIMERIADLLLRMRTPDAELAATVHFAARSLEKSGAEKPTELEVFAEVKRWKHRHRPPLKDEDIAQTIRNLSVLNWLDVRPSADLPFTEDALLNV